jgi:hypothetical protein
MPTANKMNPKVQLYEDLRRFDISKIERLLREMRKRTELPVIIVYCPKIPQIEAGTIEYLDPYDWLMKEVKKVCADNNIGFINMTSRFIRFFKETGLFPRGFENTFPSKGHFNRQGHQLIAESIYRHLKASEKLKYAIHTN